jgi:secretion/DNA translocation related TadE-like protein
VLALALVAVVMVLGIGSLVIASAVLASGRARLAADVAALAGARAARDGADASRACALAGQVARTNDATLSDCSLAGERLEVAVSVQPAWWPAGAIARSRAGPPS